MVLGTPPLYQFLRVAERPQTIPMMANYLAQRAADNTEAARQNELAATRGYLLEYRRKDIIKFGVKNNQ